VEIKTIDPPQTVKDAMEKQMRAEREKRAAILNSEGVQQAQIRTAEGEKQAAILRAEGEKQSAILRAQGQAQAIETVFRSIHDGDPDPKLLAYQYLQTLPQIANSPGNTVWMIPSELTSALRTLSKAFDGPGGDGDSSPGSAAGKAPEVAAPAEVSGTPAVAALEAVTSALLPGATTVDLAGTETNRTPAANGAVAGEPEEPGPLTS
jgi:hypothetical protein